MECFEYPPTGMEEAPVAATRRRRVIKCLFDGYHGSWLPENHGEEMTWWFMKQHLHSH
jgi:hypothetical protein